MCVGDGNAGRADSLKDKLPVCAVDVGGSVGRAADQQGGVVDNCEKAEADKFIGIEDLQVNL